MWVKRGLAGLAVASSVLDVPGAASFLGEIPDGIDGVRATLKAMRRLVLQYRVDPVIRQQAENIIRYVREKDYAGEAQAIHNWVRDNIRYTRDVNDVETLKPPPFILETRQGDCDDKALLTATLMESIGIPCMFVAIATEIPDEFTHVYTCALIGTRWIASDTTEQQPFGWEPGFVGGRIVRHIK